jgi:lysophospholipase L1-like esterase
MIEGVMKKFLMMVLLVAAALPAQAQKKATLPPDVKRVIFLGDSITYGGTYTALIEAYFVTRAPERAVEFINVGLASETASGLSEPNHAGGKFPRPDLHERLARVLAQTKPDLIFACYGMNDGIYLPFEADRFKAFQDGLQRLRDAAQQTHARVIHVTPPCYDSLRSKNAAYTETLERYAAWLLDQRKQGWQVVDINGPMTAYVKEQRKANPSFMLQNDGVHPGELGHWLMAKNILLGLGAEDIKDAAGAQQMVAALPQGAHLLKLVEKREQLLRNAWLTATGHKRPGVSAGLPLPEAQAMARALTDEIAAARTADKPLPPEKSPSR